VDGAPPSARSGRNARPVDPGEPWPPASGCSLSCRICGRSFAALW
jgi:hypothetical protein